MIEYDRPESWEADVSEALSGVLPRQLIREIAEGPHEYVNDALARIRAAVPVRALAAPLLQWIGRNSLVAFHGTRLRLSDVDDIKKKGLLPLSAESRISRLERALGAHPRWPQVGDDLPAAVKRFGDGGAAGNRLGQVHLTVSRSGLMDGFNHYLKYGSEFDQHVAWHLLGEDAYALLARDGAPYLIEAMVPGDRALEAAHRHFQISDHLLAGELPNIVREILLVWAYRLHDPRFSPASLSTDCGLVFNEPVPASWIRSMQLVGDRFEVRNAAGTCARQLLARRKIFPKLGNFRRIRTLQYGNRSNIENKAHFWFSGRGYRFKTRQSIGHQKINKSEPAIVLVLV